MNALTLRNEFDQASLDTLKTGLLSMPQAELPTSHYFADGVYLRAVFRKKGVVIVGHKHKKEHLYLVLQGRVRVGKQEYPAGSIVVVEPGTQKAVIAMEDSLCATIHRLEDPDCRDLETIKAQTVEPDVTALFDAGNNLKHIGGPQ